MLVHKRIKEARNRKGMTQVEMAQYLNVARQTYLDLEAGKTEPKLGICMAICTITGVKLDWIAYGRDCNPSLEDTAKLARDKCAELQLLINRL